jgi:hypothetical protein
MQGKSAEKAAATERELNEFWPTKYETLSAAMSALSFVHLNRDRSHLK